MKTNKRRPALPVTMARRKAKGKAAGFNYGGLAAAMLLSLIAGSIGGLATYPKIATWYAGLNKPSFNPPNWLFGPAWTILYLLMGAAAFLVWQKRAADKRANEALAYFAVQFFFNIAWSFAFFGAESPLYGLAVIVMLYAAAVVTIWKFWKIDRNAALLLLPYLAWMTFATVLNYYSFVLNP